MGQDTMMQENQSSTGEMIESSERDSKEKAQGATETSALLITANEAYESDDSKTVIELIRSWKLSPRTEAHGNCSENSAGGIQNCTVLILIIFCEASSTLWVLRQKKKNTILQQIYTQRVSAKFHCGSKLL